MTEKFEEDKTQKDYEKELERIQQLVDQGVLGREMCPDPKYWHWPILHPEELPKEFEHFIPLGEVRW